MEPSKEPPEQMKRRCSITEKPVAISLLGAMRISIYISSPNEGYLKFHIYERNRCSLNEHYSKYCKGYLLPLCVES